MEKEKTLVLIKPDGIKRNLIGKIIMRFEDSGLKIIGMKMVWVDDNFAKKHYRDDIAAKHGERVRNDLIKYIREGPIIAMVLEGVDAIKVTRKIVGSTYPNESLPGTIRGDFAHISRDYANANEISVRNLIHASGNEEDAKIEIPLWFDKKEMHSYKTVHDIICFEEKD
ncbi:MAG: nucleoside-diphosphate kinase [archaeon]|nr:nucleoside-diphosphate kinase [archaeon]